MSIMETQRRPESLAANKRANFSGSCGYSKAPAILYEASLVNDLDIVFENMITLFGSIGIITGITETSCTKLTPVKAKQRIPQTIVNADVVQSPLSRIFQKQFQVMMGSLERCRGFIVGDFAQLEQHLSDELTIESELESKLDSLTASLGGLSCYSPDMTTPSPPPLGSPTVHEISEILSLRDKLLSQLEE